MALDPDPVLYPNPGEAPIPWVGIGCGFFDVAEYCGEVGRAGNGSKSAPYSV